MRSLDIPASRSSSKKNGKDSNHLFLDLGRRVGFSMTIQQARRVRAVEIVAIGGYYDKKTVQNGVEYPYYYIRIHFPSTKDRVNHFWTSDIKIKSLRWANRTREMVCSKVARFVFDRQKQPGAIRKAAAK